MSAAVAHALPPSILALFAARPPIDYKPPIEKRKMLGYTTMAQFVKHFEDPSETPPAVIVESIEDRRTRIRALKEEAYKAKLDAAVSRVGFRRMLPVAAAVAARVLAGSAPVFTCACLLDSLPGRNVRSCQRREDWQGRPVQDALRGADRL